MRFVKGGILRVSSNRVLTCRCGLRQVWRSVSVPHAVRGAGTSRVIGDQVLFALTYMLV
jgi:hypothetical protein